MEHEFIPKELMDIKWDQKIDDGGEFINPQYWKEKSATYKILHDEFVKVFSSDSEDEKVKKEPSPVKKKVTNKSYVMHKPFNGYPATSTLTALQQEVYLDLMKKFTNYHSPFLNPQEQRELQTYRVLQEKVNKEQLEYLQFLRDFACANQSRYMSIDPNIRRYINELWKSRLKIPQRYPRFYEAYRTVALALEEVSSGYNFIPEDIKLQLGGVKRLNLMRRPVYIETKYSHFIEKHPILDSDSETENAGLKNFPVSQDKNAVHVATVTNADFVISSSGIKTICDNHAPLFHNSWELPVTVKECEVQVDGFRKRKNIIFIDKALPRKKLTVVDKINWFYKVAVRRALVGPQCAIKLDKYKRNKKTPQENISMDFGSCNEDDPHEIFGVEGSECNMSAVTKAEESKRNKNRESHNENKTNLKCDKNDDDSDYSDSDEGNLVIEEEFSSGEGVPLSTPNSSNSLKEGYEEKKVSIEEASGNNLDISSVSLEKSHKKVSKINTTPTKVDMIYQEVNKTPPKDMSVTNTDIDKPVTRSMSKMLENIQKIEKIVSKKDSNNIDQCGSIIRNLTLDSSESNSVEQPEEDDVDMEKREDVQQEVMKKTSLSKGNKPKKAHSGRPSILDDILEQQKKMLGCDVLKNDDTKSLRKRIRRDNSVLTDYNPVLPPERGNLIYRTFTFSKKSGEGSAFKILVRSKYDGMEFIGKVRMANIVPKVEFQPEFGAEVVTLSELTRQWLSLILNPESSIVRGRIDAFSGKFLMVEQKITKDLQREEKIHNIQASSCLNTLYSVLRGLSSIPPGHYILKHDAKMGAFANLYQALEIPRDGSYDLHKEYDVDATVEEPQTIANVWIPIDFGIITPFHEATKRVPGTFNPAQNKKAAGRKRKK